MKIDIETLRKTKGIGAKTLERIIKQHKKAQNEIQYFSEIQKQKAPKEWRVPLNNIYQGEAVDFMRKNVPNDSVDLVVTSPPYDDLREYNGFKFNYKMMLEEIYRVLDVGGVCVWVVGDATIGGSKTGTSFKQALYAKEVGFNIYDVIIYEKSGSAPPHPNRYFNAFEYMFVLSKGKPKTINLLKDKKNKWGGQLTFGNVTRREKDGSLTNKGQKRINEYGIRTNIWRYNNGKGFATSDDIAHNHPAIFPEKLPEDHILSWSNKGDIILDPMCGSGTTCKMAKLNDRNFIGIDISEEYVVLAKDRIHNHEKGD